ncbi:uncharacterized protein FOMMEDRAFT_162515 [Fomitiporia mediterranea MF3/22]|uniref:uncharacterized protein n=1 Tax=Fomitiporia mediterranea (strain MF3/22) TaxID=694068 RepID=UPI000440951C|nr:uncharacterized protein FOMMEDRAFT_162515 [Fomitiporia mediterranea MF3/22]EJC98157.1 hypothetical protein FOMMEDRAFT_162515 [Fomitiporia mediterranea MF3/22]
MQAKETTLMTTRNRTLAIARRGIAPLGSEFLVILAVLFSLLFIFSASLAFVNSEVGPIFKDALNSISVHQSGLVLVGENVDVDVDEPSVTIRWSALGCGGAYLLPGSPNLHGSSACGLPAIPLDLFISNSEAPVFSYNPESVPISKTASQRIVVQAHVQFDNDLVLDVHDSRLYPFDSYLVSTSIRATTSNSSVKDIPMPIVGMPVVEHMPSFTMTSRDTDVVLVMDEDNTPARHIEIRIRRPAHARVYAMLIFGINWAFCHYCIGMMLLSIFQGHHAGKEVLKRFASSLLVLFVIPQLRGAMPDAPGFDGVLIDTIGFFPQMTLAGLSAIILLLFTAKHELDGVSGKDDFRHHDKGKGKDTLLGQSFLDGRDWEASFQSNAVRNGFGQGSGQGHSRTLSARDFLLEQVLKVVDAGSQAFRNNFSGGNSGRYHHHQRSQSYYERKMA